MADDQRALLVQRMVAEGTSDDDIRATLKVFDAQQSAEPQKTGVLQTAKDLGVGALKGLGSTIASIGEGAVNSGMIPGMARGGGAMRHPAFTRSDEATTASNDTQRVGKTVEQVAEFAVPAGAAVNAIPRMARAGRNFQKVMGVAKNVPLNVEGPGQVALRLQQLAERGGTEPRVVGKLLRRVTDPEKAPMNFEEGRDFYSNISRLSANEFNSLNPTVQREMGNLRAALNQSLEQAAGSVGKGELYAGAMKEYAQAAKVRAMKDGLVSALKKAALPAGGAAGTLYWLQSKLGGVSGDDD